MVRVVIYNQVEACSNREGFPVERRAVFCMESSRIELGCRGRNQRQAAHEQLRNTRLRSHTFNILVGQAIRLTGAWAVAERLPTSGPFSGPPIAPLAGT